MVLIPNVSKYLLRTKTSQKLSLRTFDYNNKGTREVKDFQKLSDQEMHFILQSNSTKYNKLFKFISRRNSFERHHILVFKIWGRTSTDWFKNCLYGNKFFNPEIHRMGNVPNILCPR